MRWDKAEVCVIGCGGGGAVAAKELAERGLTVTVLEAGPWHRDPEAEYSGLEWDMVGVNGRFRWGPADRKEAPWQRRLVGLTVVLQVAGVGGTTLHYSGNSPRAYPAAFDRRWPLTYRDLVPYYERVEATLPVVSVEGLSLKDAIFAEGCERAGLPRITRKDVAGEGWRPQPNAILAANCTRCGHCFVGCVDPPGEAVDRKAKRSTDVSYVPAALRTGRCRILPNSFVRRILVERGRVRGVVYRDQGGVLQELRTHVVVLSAGTIESPRLWLNSDLPNDADVVGRFLTTHYSDIVTGFFDRDTAPFLGQTSEARADFPGHGFLETLGNAPGYFAASVFGQGEVATSHDRDPWRTMGPLWGEALRKRMGEFPRSLSISAITDDAPVHSNRVQLSDGDGDVDEHGRFPFVTYRPTPDTVRRRDWLAHRAAAILVAAGARRDSIHRSNLNPVGIHMHGTMRMGQDPRTSVVDANCEAHAVKGLFVADNSVFPNALGGPNPTLTCQALATRTAERIARLYFS